MFAAAVMFGTTGTAQHFAPAGTPSTTLGLGRLAVGAATLLVVMLARRQRLHRSGLPALAVAAAAMAAYQPFFFGGVARTGIAVGTIVAIGSAPILAGVLGRAVRSERVTVAWLGATVVALTGTGLLVSGGEEIGIDVAGIAMALGAGASYAVFAVAAKGLLDTQPATAVMAAVFTGAALLLTPYAFVDDLGWLATGRGVTVVVHLGVITTAAAYLLYSAGLRRIDVGSVATLTLGEPLTAALLGIVVVGETLSVRAWMGAGLVAAALVAVSLQGRHVEPLPPPDRVRR